MGDWGGTAGMARVRAGVDPSGGLCVAFRAAGFRQGGGRLALLRADCIVLLPGLFGDNGVLRTRDLAIALRDQGFHVLALELRGHGQTDRRYPNVYYTFGVLECQDLLRVSEWLEDSFAHVSRTGLVGVCWGANLGLLTAWFDGRGPDDPSITPELARSPRSGLAATPLSGRGYRLSPPCCVGKR